MKNKYLPGEKYHRLTILRDAGFNNFNQRQVLCLCDCGKECIVKAANLRSNTHSCGCYAKERRAEGYRRNNTKHAMSKSSEYNIWNSIRSRCRNPKCKEYDRYGKLGVTMYEPWLNSFDEFIAYMGKRPGPRYSIDRIDNSKGYIPGNVRWATYSQQALNKRKLEGCTSRFRGVSWDSGSRVWKAHIGYGGKTYYIGCFHSEEEAYKAFVEKYVEKYGCRPPYEE